ncbi:FidL-like protein [Budvicia diplopodorum]|uniref:FidL-like protein n=1 Tax=Budvicia diplopodorum TaxID=1119056 RepID=UPI001358E3B9|nr:FidL-like protein [Budvicia diplopodorum]
MKNNKLYAIIVLIMTVVFFGELYLIYRDRLDSFTCSSNITYLYEKSNQENEAELQSNMHFTFDNNKGENVITGHLSVNDKDYVIDRKVLFDYTKSKINSYVLVATDILLGSKDNLPKDLAERYLYRFSTERHESTHLTIHYMNNGKKLFSSSTLPYFICE